MLAWWSFFTTKSGQLWSALFTALWTELLLSSCTKLFSWMTLALEVTYVSNSIYKQNWTWWFLDDLGLRLEKHIKRFGTLVKLIRKKERQGLIRARLVGAEVATGDVLVFLDAHCEANVQWWLILISKNILNLLIINCNFETQQARADCSTDQGETVGRDLSDNRRHQWLHHGLPARLGRSCHWRFQLALDVHLDRLAGKNSTVPTTYGSDRVRIYYDFFKINYEYQYLKHQFSSPTMAGGLLAAERKYFFEIGGYDPGMDIWGGENLEISFRVRQSTLETRFIDGFSTKIWLQTWMCGGSLEFLPCSRVGHIFRHGHTYNITGDPHGKNSMRLTEAWMDEYKRLFYFYRKDLKVINFIVMESKRMYKKGMKPF